MGGMHSPRSCRLGDRVYVVVAIIAVLAYNDGDIVLYCNFFQHLKYIRLNTTISCPLAFVFCISFNLFPLKMAPRNHNANKWQQS